MTKREVTKDASLMVSEWIDCLLKGTWPVQYELSKRHCIALEKIQAEMYKRGLYEIKRKKGR